jgi:hypothetical protein
MKNKILSAVLCLVLLAIYFACEKDDAFVKEKQSIESSDLQKMPNIKTVSIDEVGETFNTLKSRYQLDGFLKSNTEANTLSRNTIDTLGITIYIDDIKEVTLDDYTSYTMLIALPESDSTKFYNLTIEDENGEEGMFMTKYTPTQEWLDDKSKAYEGTVKTARIDVITQEFPPDGGGEIEINNTQYNDYSTPQGSPYYPTDCDGVVIITIEEVPYPCSCNPSHMPWESCGCELLENGSPPGYDLVPFYYCDAYGNGWDEK